MSAPNVRAPAEKWRDLRDAIKPIRDDLRRVLAERGDLRAASKRQHMPLVDALVGFGRQAERTPGHGWAKYVERAALSLELAISADDAPARKAVESAASDLATVLENMNNP